MIRRENVETQTLRHRTNRETYGPEIKQKDKRRNQKSEDQTEEPNVRRNQRERETKVKRERKRIMKRRNVVAFV